MSAGHCLQVVSDVNLCASHVRAGLGKSVARQFLENLLKPETCLSCTLAGTVLILAEKPDVTLWTLPEPAANSQSGTRSRLGRRWRRLTRAHGTFL